MLKAKDFRYYAREALKGRWLNAGATGLVAGLLGAAIGTGGYGFSFNYTIGNERGGGMPSNAGRIAAGVEIPAVIFAVILGVLLVFTIWLIICTVIGGATTLGYAKYNLNIVDDNDPKFKDIFSQYDRLGTGFGMQFFRALFTFLWSLLLIIPGIIASYGYSMTPFILAENPQMTAREAIRESKELMRGNKWRLFCLELSFIGWSLLAVAITWIVMMLLVLPLIFVESEVVIAIEISAIVTALIVMAVILCLTLNPYVIASITVFYREIRERKYSNPQIEGEVQEYTDDEPPLEAAVTELQDLTE